jgi:hypothetical protein
VLGIHLQDDNFLVCEDFYKKWYYFQNSMEISINYFTSSLDPKPTGVPVDFKLMIKSFTMVSILLNTRDIQHIALRLVQVNLTSG